MSQQNVEIVREQFEATNRRDFARPMADWADDVEVVSPEGANAGTYSGREAVGDFFGDWFRTFGGGVHFDVRNVADSGNAVAVAVHHRARGRQSGLEVANDIFYEYRLRDAKIVRIRFHRSWRAALEAIGLSEQDANRTGSPHQGEQRS
jgi:ketosteroid isomerase-like protein